MNDLETLVKRADQGDADAQYELGYRYAMETSLFDAIWWLEKATDQGHKDAERILKLITITLKENRKDTRAETLKCKVNINEPFVWWGVKENEK